MNSKQGYFVVDTKVFLIRRPNNFGDYGNFDWLVYKFECPKVLNTNLQKE